MRCKSGKKNLCKWWERGKSEKERMEKVKKRRGGENRDDVTKKQKIGLKKKNNFGKNLKKKQFWKKFEKKTFLKKIWKKNIFEKNLKKKHFWKKLEKKTFLKKIWKKNIFGKNLKKF